MKSNYVLYCPGCKQKMTRYMPRTQKTWLSFCGVAGRRVRLHRVRMPK